MTAIVSLTFLLSVLIPVTVFWNARRLRKLSESRLQIARLVTKMEELMLSGEISLGAASHDVLFRVMQKIQYADRYHVNWNLLQTPNSAVRRMEEKLNSELRESGCPFAENLKNFTSAYYKAFRHKHPLEAVCYSAYIFFLRGGAKLLLESVRSISSAMSTVEEVKKAWMMIKAEAREKFFISSKATYFKRDTLAPA